jgi:L-ascorbate metabolism protein UlaG (beta-lactamase superfamily)
VDVALLPVSGTYVMDAQEAAEAVKKIRPTHVVPMHWGSIVGSRADAERFAQLVAGLTTVHILDPQG